MDERDPANRLAVRAACEVAVTAPNPEEAEALGRMAVERRLAACAQVSGPITSTYWWDGEVTSATEWTVTLKTSLDRRDALMGVLRDAHSYEVPQIVATTIDGDPDYLAWIEAETSGDPGTSTR